MTWVSPPERSAEFDAHENAPGENAERGTFKHSDPVGTFTVEVTCVNIQGDRARFSGEVVDASGGYTDKIGGGRVTNVLDGGTPGREGDRLGGSFSGSPSPSCGGDLSGIQPKHPITEGNLTVQDNS